MQKKKKANHFKSTKELEKKRKSTSKSIKWQKKTCTRKELSALLKNPTQISLVRKYYDNNQVVGSVSEIKIEQIEADLFSQEQILSKMLYKN